MQTQATTRWGEIVSDPVLRDLPYKVETNQYGQIVLSPHTYQHSDFHGAVERLLAKHVPAAGHAGPEYPVATPAGTKVPDVVWISEGRHAQIPSDAADSPIMPELCVEVLSGSTEAEIKEKRRLYIGGGAEEVWVVSTAGDVRFYGPEGGVQGSRLAPGFPSNVEV